MLGDRWSSTFTKSNSTLWPATYPVSEDYEKQPGVSDRPCPARRCRAQRRTESHWRWRGPSPPDWPWSPSWRASPRPPPRQSRPSSCASISRPRGQGWKPDKYQRCEGRADTKLRQMVFSEFLQTKVTLNFNSSSLTSNLNEERCWLVVEMEISIKLILQFQNWRILLSRNILFP